MTTTDTAGRVMKIYTTAEIAALTMLDVAKAKQRVFLARETREGVTTLDYILSAVGNRQISGARTSRVLTLDDAKAALRQTFAKDGRLA